MNIYEIAKTMTKEEFLSNRELTGCSGCPYECGLFYTEDYCKDNCHTHNCEECWTNILEKENIKFIEKADDEKVLDKHLEIQKKIIEDLRVVKRMCDSYDLDCCECSFYKSGECILKLNNEKVFNSCFKDELDKIEERFFDMTEEKINIYEVEHAQGGKRYDFISDEELKVNDFVVCNTCMGKSYGVVKAIKTGRDNSYKKCKKLR